MLSIKSVEPATVVTYGTVETVSELEVVRDILAPAAKIMHDAYKGSDFFCYTPPTVGGMTATICIETGTFVNVYQRNVETETTVDEFRAGHFHQIDGKDRSCLELNHCPSICDCDRDNCTVAVV